MGEKPTVSVVDDDPSHLSSMKRLLRVTGSRAECLPTARALIERLSTPAYGCAVTDLKMPGMDGMEHQGAPGTLGTSLPRVFLDGYGDIRGGAGAFLMKTAPSAERSVKRHRTSVMRKLRVFLDGYGDIRGGAGAFVMKTAPSAERSVKRHRMSVMRKLRDPHAAPSASPSTPAPARQPESVPETPLGPHGPVPAEWSLRTGCVRRSGGPSSGP